jgi:hypothetical protein
MSFRPNFRPLFCAIDRLLGAFRRYAANPCGSAASSFNPAMRGLPETALAGCAA